MPPAASSSPSQPATAVIPRLAPGSNAITAETQLPHDLEPVLDSRPAPPAPTARRAAHQVIARLQHAAVEAAHEAEAVGPGSVCMHERPERLGSDAPLLTLALVARRSDAPAVLDHTG